MQLNAKKLLPHIEMKASKTQVVHSGKYLINISDICEQTNIKYICCNFNGPIQ